MSIGKSKIFVCVVVGLLCSSPARTAAPDFKPFLPFDQDEWAPSSRSVFSVASTGVAIWSMPIWGPQGRNGVEPHVSITYRSVGNSGILGLRFSLDGISSALSLLGHPRARHPLFCDARLPACRTNFVSTDSALFSARSPPRATYNQSLTRVSSSKPADLHGTLTISPFTAPTVVISSDTDGETLYPVHPIRDCAGAP